VVVLSLGSALLVNVSLGPMAGEIGAASILVWTFTAFVGLVQCLLLGELGSRYPNAVGGPAAYVHEGLKHVSPLIGALAAWAYWTAWTPGVAVHVMLAAGYVKAAFWPEADLSALIATFVVLLYAANYFGLSFLFWTSSVLAVCALGPLLLILVVPLLEDGAWRAVRFEAMVPHHAWYSAPALALLAKWMFVATWSSYGAEMASTLVGALRPRRQEIPKVLAVAGTLTFISFTLTPAALVANVGAEMLAADPYVVFLTAARGTFGASGTAVVSVMLIAALLSGAQLFIISSSRALYEMSRNGFTLQMFNRVNRHGVPVGSVAWDALVTVALLAIFGQNVVHVVAAANVSYLLVFVLLPVAYLLVRKREAAADGVRTLPRFMTPVAAVVAVVNVVLLIAGGIQWGGRVIGVGVALVALGIPAYLHRQRAVARPGEVVA
jgi:amino acid transporter